MSMLSVLYLAFTFFNIKLFDNLMSDANTHTHTHTRLSDDQTKPSVYMDLENKKKGIDGSLLQNDQKQQRTPAPPFLNSDQISSLSLFLSLHTNSIIFFVLLLPGCWNLKYTNMWSLRTHTHIACGYFLKYICLLKVVSFFRFFFEVWSCCSQCCVCCCKWLMGVFMGFKRLKVI